MDRIVSTDQRESGGDRPIPCVAATRAGDGLLMQAERRGRRYRWRPLVRDDDTAGAVFEEPAASGRGCRSASTA